MSEIRIRDNSCENCAKFSHCNNNDLVCIRKFQQIKAENKELCSAIEHSFKEQSDRNIETLQDDIYFGVIDRDITETEFYKRVVYSARNSITNLKQENEKLKKLLNQSKESEE